MITCNSLRYALKEMQHILFDVQQSRYEFLSEKMSVNTDLESNFD